ncbi:vacuolar protein sorting-associated protein 33A [Dermatophagoides farinae]|uniref:Vacuolar protein sorting-associated protein 33a-like protein n=1 Tax=Dermatophagoides farinae TaxID=6954 RepID=A0A9D4NLE7_DERFA|nr:vacuolar protein sorting-associated protein 33A-like isoform X1 [Dermatophagoides farinae]XP_046918142.1 vacuolar protein sorting-associated protein 33A-like isoform X2 [Dermatophagoides farinae]XP_046918143.1 vacuolar protein sorting-associated protein 33A-like isoform X3 [Dermatophagoides farinae]KAH7636266.1 vacuolar protein sorting-associated protein 33a-like protein [Dermatophagoides farinae]
MSHLNSGRLNLSSLRDFQRTDLFALLDSIDGTKAIVWDQQLIAPFELISNIKSFMEHKVIQNLKFRSVQGSMVEAQNVVYFIRPTLSYMDTIAEDIRASESIRNCNFHIIFVPRKCILCEKRLETLGVFGSFTTIEEYSPDFFVLDSDVISIEWPLCFRECNLEMDYSSLYQLAKSLMTLQCAFGIIPSVYGIGRLSKILYDYMNKMKSELISIENNVVSMIDQLILIDRSVDLLSPSITQLTYEGLLDEIYGINQTAIRLPPEKFITNNDDQTTSSAPKKSQVGKFYLNSGDELFKKLRDLYYLRVGPVLRVSAKNLTTQFDERRTAKTVREIKQFVEKIPYLQRLRNQQANHTSMAELIREVTDREEFHERIFCENELLNCFEIDSINPFIETCISRSEDIITVLRLILLQTICANGLKQKTLDYYKREILQTYGYQHLLTLNAMEKCGLLRISNGYGISYSGLRVKFRLTKESSKSNNANVNNGDNQLILYQGQVHDVYFPFTVRIVQHIDQFGYRSFNDAFTRQCKPEPNGQNPYTIFEENQSTGNIRRRRNSDTTSMQSTSETNDKLVLVLFIGGCTFSEISALRLLAQKENVNSEFIIATTSIINGKTLLQSIADPLSTKKK